MVLRTSVWQSACGSRVALFPTADQLLEHSGEIMAAFARLMTEDSTTSPKPNALNSVTLNITIQNVLTRNPPPPPFPEPLREDAKDGSNGDAGINVATAIQGIEPFSKYLRKVPGL